MVWQCTKRVTERKTLKKWIFFTSKYCSETLTEVHSNWKGFIARFHFKYVQSFKIRILLRPFFLLLRLARVKYKSWEILYKPKRGDTSHSEKMLCASFGSPRCDTIISNKSAASAKWPWPSKFTWIPFLSLNQITTSTAKI